MSDTSGQLFTYVFDASSLINIERTGNMRYLRQRSRELMIPAKVADEVSEDRRKPLAHFLEKHPNLVTAFTTQEETKYPQIRRQQGIHDGEAAAIAMALTRPGVHLVMDDKMGRAKAESHRVKRMSWQEFLAPLFPSI